MKRINITLDEETAKVLEKKVNKSETIRQALLIHNGDVSTDTLVGMRVAFKQILHETKETQARLVELYELVESLKQKMDELTS